MWKNTLANGTRILKLHRRRILAWAALAILAIVILRAMAGRDHGTPVPRDEAARPPAAGDESFSSPGIAADPAATTLAVRNKLEQPISLVFSKADLPSILAMISREIDLTFLCQADAGLMDNISVNTAKAPLRVILGEMLYERNLAFLAQPDGVVIIACDQTAHQDVEGQATSQFSAEAEVLLTLNAPCELFCGEQAQFRIRLVAQKPARTLRPGAREFLIHTALYHNAQLIGLTTARATDNEWSEVSFPTRGAYYLRLRPVAESPNDLALTVVFDYGVPALENP